MTLSKLPGGRNTAANVVVYRLNIAQSYKLVEQKFNDYNSQQSDKKNRLKAAHFALAKKLVELFTARFWEWQAKHGFSFTPSTPLPTLSINNVTLAEWIFCTDRSVRNYRQKLQQCGFILDTISHGTKKNFELALNPEFLWMAVNTHTNRVVLSIAERSRSEAPVQNFPQTSSGYPERELTGTVCGKKLEPSTAMADAEMVQEQQELENGNERREESTPFGATGTLTGTPPSCAAPPAPAVENAFQRRAGRLLIQYSLPLLHPKTRYWNAHEKGQMEAQAARLFEGVTEQNLNKILDNYCLRVLMAAHHYQRFTGVPIPHPAVFFNPDEPAGFVLTRNWPQYPDQFPIIRAKTAPKVRTSKPQDNGRIGGQMEIGQLAQMMMQ